VAVLASRWWPWPVEAVGFVAVNRAASRYGGMAGQLGAAPVRVYALSRV
jgi:hypothetical protein